VKYTCNSYRNNNLRKQTKPIKGQCKKHFDGLSFSILNRNQAIHEMDTAHQLQKITPHCVYAMRTITKLGNLNPNAARYSGHKKYWTGERTRVRFINLSCDRASATKCL